MPLVIWCVCTLHGLAFKRSSGQDFSLLISRSCLFALVPAMFFLLLFPLLGDSRCWKRTFYRMLQSEVPFKLRSLWSSFLVSRSSDPRQSGFAMLESAYARSQDPIDWLEEFESVEFWGTAKQCCQHHDEEPFGFVHWCFGFLFVWLLACLWRHLWRGCGWCRQNCVLRFHSQWFHQFRHSLRSKYIVI